MCEKMKSLCPMPDREEVVRAYSILTRRTENDR